MNDYFYSMQFLLRQYAYQHQCDINVFKFDKGLEELSNEENQ